MRPGRSSDVEHLVSGEQLRISVRRHAAAVTWPVLRAALGVGVLVWLQVRVPGSAVVVQNVLWYASVVVLVHLAVLLRSWWVERLEVTTSRLLLTQGIITRTVTMMPLRKVTDLTFTHTPVGRVLGYATMKVESAGEDDALNRIAYLPWHTELRDELATLVFGLPREQDGED